jgi:hypothetical protein
VSPNATQTEVVGKILYLRQNYHFGPGKIAMYLKRYHDVTISQSGGVADPQAPRHEPAPDIAALQATRQTLAALREAAPRPPGPDRREVRGTDQGIAGEEVLPVHGHRRLHPAAGPSHLSTAQSEDRHPVRRLRPREAALCRPGHPDGQRVRIRLFVQLPPARQGVGHRYIKPRTPRLNGKVERSHRIDAEEFYRLLDGAVIDDAKVFNHKLQEWEDYYNYDRPHGGLGGQTPYERLKAKDPGPRVSGDRQLHIFVVGRPGLDPGTLGLKVPCSSG